MQQSLNGGVQDANAADVNPKAEAMRARTKRFALDVLKLIDSMRLVGTTARISYQLCDAATSVGANYRAACRARSDAEFAAKIGLVLEEADESLFWLEVCDARNIGEPTTRRQLLREADELTAIFVASSIAARERLRRGRRSETVQSVI